jgi:hypothetical protein
MVRTSVSALLVLTAVAAATCPLGFPPEQACEASTPTCALFTDADGDGLCDNPGPQAVPDTVAIPPDTVQVIDPNPPDTTSAVGPDTSAVIEPDTTETTVPDTTGAPPDTVLAPEDTTAVFPDTLVQIPSDTAAVQTDTTVALSDTAAVAAIDTSAATPPWQPVPNGCPRYLPPAAACPFDRQLCPHWYGRLPSGACLNPSEGLRRATFNLVAIAVLLVPATILSRSIRGRKNRKKARLVRTLALVVSLAVLGFWLQGCYCPIGMWQYLFLKTFGFLTWIGFALLMLPIVHAMFFGRIFCGWVCPIGALQEMLGRIPVPGIPRVPRRLDRVLVALKYVIAVLFTSSVFAAGRGLFGMVWPALFCEIDPFHTIFSTFLAGSLTLGVAAIVLSVFFGRFYCRYLCFYGAILSLACRFGLWSRIRRAGGSRSCDAPGTSVPSCEIESGEE